MTIGSLTACQTRSVNSFKINKNMEEILTVGNSRRGVCDSVGITALTARHRGATEPLLWQDTQMCHLVCF